MGTWGEESYSNDHCWDMLKAVDIHNMTQKESNSSVYGAFKALSEGVYEFEAFLGTVIWVLGHGKSVKKRYLTRALKIAKFLFNSPNFCGSETPCYYLDDWKFPKVRKDALADEIKTIEYALKHDGKVVHLIEE